MRIRPIRLWLPVAALPSLLFLFSCGTPDPGGVTAILRPPSIDPDYSGIVIPPNIAPMNFRVLEKGRAFRIEIAGPEGETIRLNSRTPTVRIPPSRWRSLLGRSRGGELRLTVAALDSQNRWNRFDPIVNRVSEDEIDGILVYRKFLPLYILRGDKALFERHLADFHERKIFDSRAMNDGCFNCHSFLNNRTDRWLIHLRGAPSTAMLLNMDGRTELVRTQTELNKAPAAYPAWHPRGRFIAFAVIKVKQFFHTAGDNRDVYDLDSDLILYDAESNTVASSPSIADPGRLETYPAWTPDGRTLFFCSAPAYDTTAFFERHAFRRIRYELTRVAFDPAAGSFGRPETVLASAKTGLSATHPRVSPDGRFLLFCQCEYGNFSIYQKSSDLYMMDLASGSIRRLGINSNRSDSHHCWSSNGRWFVFSSKRADGMNARPYFTHVDGEGGVSKPFLLPQEDPAFYESCLHTFNIPELVTEPIPQSPQKLLDSARRTKKSLQAKAAGLRAAPRDSVSDDGSWWPAPR